MIQKIYTMSPLNGDGFIRVYSKGTLKCYFDITYILNKKQVVIVSPIMMPLRVENIIIPKKAKEIKFRGFAESGLNKWTNVCIKAFSAVPKICFNIIVTSMYRACIETPCNLNNCINIKN